MILGATVFEWEPDEMTIPDTKKTVSVVPTHSGSAIFQWPAMLQGTTVTLKWDFMSIAQYNALREEYLKTEEITFDTGLATYMVIVIGMNGTYSKVHLEDLPYRMDVKLDLDIRS